MWNFVHHLVTSNKTEKFQTANTARVTCMACSIRIITLTYMNRTLLFIKLINLIDSANITNWIDLNCKSDSITRAHLKWLKLGRAVISYEQKPLSAVTTSTKQCHVNRRLHHISVTRSTSRDCNLVWNHWRQQKKIPGIERVYKHSLTFRVRRYVIIAIKRTKPVHRLLFLSPCPIFL